MAIRDDLLRRLLRVSLLENDVFPRADLLALLDDLRAYLTEADATDRFEVGMKVWLSEVCCRQVDSDHEAELVRRGIRLGLTLADFDRVVYHRAVATTGGAKGGRRRAVSDEEIKRAINESPTKRKASVKLGIEYRTLLRRIAKMKRQKVT